MGEKGPAGKPLSERRGETVALIQPVNNACNVSLAAANPWRKRQRHINISESVKMGAREAACEA